MPDSLISTQAWLLPAVRRPPTSLVRFVFYSLIAHLCLKLGFRKILQTDSDFKMVKALNIKCASNKNLNI